MTTPCRLSVTAYSIYSKLSSILEAVPPSPTWGSAMPSWQEHSYYLLWLLLSGIPRDACGQPHAQGANRHCQCPCSLPKVSRAFRYKCLMSDLMRHEITAHLESKAGVLPHPPPPYILHLAPSDYHLLLRKRRGCPQGGLEMPKRTSNLSAILKFSSGRNAHILMRIL
jgi:hypothetical protein